MRLYEITEAVTDEFSVFNALKFFNLSATEYKNLSLQELNSLWKRKVVELNRSKTGTELQHDLSWLNRSHDVLKADKLLYNNNISTNTDQVTTVTKSDNPNAPIWQPDKQTFNNTIRVESYRDPNYLKKHIWELSGKSNEIYTLEAFSNGMFQGRISVYGSFNTYGEMAQAMLVYNANGGKLSDTRAIFVTKKDDPNKLYLIYSDGKSFAEQPIPLDYHGPDFHKDQDFKEKLNLILNKIKSLHQYA
jgi:hypothetical protein